MDQADVVFTAPPSSLRAYPVRRNAAARRKTVVMEDLPVVAGAEYEALLVRTALIRSDRYREGKYLASLSTPPDVVRLVAHLANANQEHLVTIPVNNAFVPLAVHETGIGPAGYAAVDARDVLRIALLTSATALFIAHNHPSGDPSPSREDKEMLKALKDAAGCLGFDVLDSFIVAYNGWYTLINNERHAWSEVLLDPE
jgi:DNA repair protein RadC